MRVLVCVLVVACVLVSHGVDAQSHWKKSVLPPHLRGGKSEASKSEASSSGSDFAIAGKTGSQVLASLSQVVPAAVQHLAKLGARAASSSAEYLGHHRFATVNGLIQKANVKVSAKASAVVSLAAKSPSAAELTAIVNFVNAAGGKAGPSHHTAKFIELDQAPRKPKGRSAPGHSESAHASGHSSSASTSHVYVIVVKAAHGPAAAAKKGGKFLELASAVAQAPRKPKGTAKPGAKPTESSHKSESSNANAWKRTAATKDIKGLKHPNLFIVDEHYTVLSAPPAAQMNLKL